MSVRCVEHVKDLLDVCSLLTSICVRHFKSDRGKFCVFHGKKVMFIQNGNVNLFLQFKVSSAVTKLLLSNVIF